MTLGSFFDGIGGWLLAAKHAGVTPIWSSEIDDYCQAVTHYHFPEVVQMGDITKIKAEDLEPVDIICAGSPCQDLSVAGKREGLAGERSGLFVDAIKLVHGLRKRTGKPRYFVWENVPGAFSSNKGFDFRAVLEEITKTEVPMPANGKWADSGMVEWNGGSLAWRVLDAQYWGVPQRRKRIFLVADFTGQSAGEILFEREGLHGDSSESEREGQEAAGNAGTSVNCAGWDAYQHHNWRKSNQLGPLTTGVGRVRGDTPLISCYDMTHADEVIRPVTGGKTNCLNSRMGIGGNQEPVVLEPGSMSRLGNHVYKGIAPTLRAHFGDNLPAICIAGNTIGRQLQNGGNGAGNQEELAYTLNTVDRHAVALPQLGSGKPTVGCLMANCGTKQWLGNQEAFSGDYHIVTKKTVRRLTPTECERLQGLSDGYTDIEFNGKPAPDSRRYKAIGNGMAQPVADFVIRRIAEVVSNET